MNWDTMTVEEIVAHVNANPVKSVSHEWAEGEQKQYDSLRARQRTLYDNLRTQAQFTHTNAFRVAFSN